MVSEFWIRKCSHLRHSTGLSHWDISIPGIYQWYAWTGRIIVVSIWWWKQYLQSTKTTNSWQKWYAGWPWHSRSKVWMMRIHPDKHDYTIWPLLVKLFTMGKYWCAGWWLAQIVKSYNHYHKGSYSKDILDSWPQLFLDYSSSSNEGYADAFWV